MGSPTGHSHTVPFSTPWGALQRSRHYKWRLTLDTAYSRVLVYTWVGWGKCMLRAFLRDSTSTWHNQDSNPGPSDPEARCLPLDQNAIKPLYSQQWMYSLYYCSSNTAPAERISWTYYNFFRHPKCVCVWGGVVAQSLECATLGEKVLGSIPAVAARSLLLGSV